MSANAELITVEIYVQQGKTIEKQFFIYMAKMFFFVYIFVYLKGLSCFPAILSPISMYMSNKESIGY